MKNRPPWRRVVQIWEVIGPKSGRKWRLWLDCGHAEYVAIPRPKSERQCVMREIRLAPRKMRCVSCWIAQTNLKSVQQEKGR